MSKHGSTMLNRVGDAIQFSRHLKPILAEVMCGEHLILLVRDEMKAGGVKYSSFVQYRDTPNPQLKVYRAGFLCDYAADAIAVAEDRIWNGKRPKTLTNCAKPDTMEVT